MYSRFKYHKQVSSSFCNRLYDTKKSIEGSEIDNVI